MFILVECWVRTLALLRLEPCAGKLACTVLRRVGAGNSSRLSDFASVEQLDFPELKGHPIGITNGESGTCIITCSYEARRYGIKTGMRVRDAKGLCPHFISRASRPQRYAKIASDIMAALKTITPNIEIFSVDEAFLDITRCQTLYGHPLEIAKRVKQTVYDI